ncbi:MAG: CpsD/CapB family tyrosine-protein kinase [Solirubrobacterales bacterium]|nr:CpsD/CapB family tyrosine-protein kinase [Solirubrobacterales bacterium]
MANLRQQLLALPKGDTVDAAALRADVQRLAAVAAVAGSDATVVDAPSPPTTPTSPKQKQDLALGLVLGLATGIALAFLLDLSDRRLKSDEELELGYGLPTLVRLPVRSLSLTGLKPGMPEFEPYRILAGAVTLSPAGSGVRSVLITSAVAGEGKTTVAVGLAMALANDGHSVTLVELDHHRPSLEDHFPLHGDDGLATAVLKREPVIDHLQHPVPSLPGLNVLPQGLTAPSDPLWLLRSPEMDHAMEQLLEVSEIVIYDATPIIGVADAQVLLDHPRIDTALIVARAYRTTQEEVRRARAILDQRVVRPLGLVLTGLDEPGAARYQYAPSRAKRAGRAVDEGLQTDGTRGPAARSNVASRTKMIVRQTVRQRTAAPHNDAEDA